MLPFTKRPGRDESGENDVVMKDDLAKPPASIPPPPVSKRSVPPPPASSAAPVSMRPKFVSAGEEEMTTLMPTKSLGTLNGAPSVRPAAGAPPPTSSKPAPSSRPGKFAASDEEEDGRTVVRGAPKIVKRTGAPNSNRMGLPTAPTTINPAAVIKASLDAARAGIKKTGDHLMAGPPSDLLEDLADRTGGAGGSSSKAKPIIDFHPADVGAEHTAILQAPVSSARGVMIEGVKALSTQAMNVQPMPHGTIPPGSVRPLTNPPPSNPASSQNLGGYASPATQSGGYAQANQSGGYNAQANQSGGYNGSITGGSSSVPGVQMPPQSMPAHFMVPHAPYSDGRVDPPGTAVTARTRVAGRPAMSWALALAAFGVFVGVGAVAAMNNNEGFAQTTASFVDPSRANGAAAPKSAAAGGQAAATPVPVPAAVDPAIVGVTPVAVPAAADPGTVAAPVVTTPAAPAVAAAPVAPAAAAAPPPAAVAAAPAAKVASAPVAAAPRPQPAPVARPASRPAPAEEKEPVAAAPAKPGKKGAGGKADTAVDEETRKALDALQKSQLESSF